MRRMLVAAFAAVSVGAACREGHAFSASGPDASIEYFEVTCRESSRCWGAVHETCPDRYAIDERDGQQVTKGAMIDGNAAINSHAEQTWLFHCRGTRAAE